MVYKRNSAIVLGHALNIYPAVTVVGARGVGKTTLVSEIAAQKGYAYCNLDEVRHSIAAQDDPAKFVASLPKPIVLDAVHRVPEILPALKEDITCNPVSGRYLCVATCDASQDKRLELLNQITHVLPLYPFSQGELLHKIDCFVDAMFHAAPLRIDDTHILPFDTEQFLSGGFAQSVGLLPRERDLWFNRYVQNVVHHDVALQVQVEDHLLFVRLLQVLARHAAQPANIAQVSRQSGIPITTLNRHLAVLKSIKLLAEQDAWDAQGKIKKVLKAPQMYLHDVGLHRWLLGSEADGLLSSLLRQGVYNELQKQMTWNASSVKLLHTRIMNGCAIDMLLERSDGKVVGINVTDATHATQQEIKGLLHGKERLGERWHRGVILHTGTDAMPLGNKIWLLPISALWSYDAIG